MREGAKAASPLDGPNAPMGTFSSRTTACDAFGLISDAEHHDLNVLRRVRNDFAQDMETLVSTPSVVDRSKTLLLIAHDYDRETRGEVRASPAGQFQTSAASLIMNLANRPHYVRQERCKPAAWRF